MIGDCDNTNSITVQRGAKAKPFVSIEVNWYEGEQECGHPNRYIYYEGEQDDPNSKTCLLCDNIYYEENWMNLQVQLGRAEKWSAAWKRVAKKWWSFEDAWHDYDRISRLLKRYEKRHPR